MSKRYYAVITVPDDWHGTAPADTRAEAATWIEGCLLSGRMPMNELGVTVYRTVADLAHDATAREGDFATDAFDLSEG